MKWLKIIDIMKQSMVQLYIANKTGNIVAFRQSSVDLYACTFSGWYLLSFFLVFISFSTVQSPLPLDFCCFECSIYLSPLHWLSSDPGLNYIVHGGHFVIATWARVWFILLFFAPVSFVEALLLQVNCSCLFTLNMRVHVLFVQFQFHTTKSVTTFTKCVIKQKRRPVHLSGTDGIII